MDPSLFWRIFMCVATSGFDHKNGTENWFIFRLNLVLRFDPMVFGIRSSSFYIFGPLDSILCTHLKNISSIKLKMHDFFSSLKPCGYCDSNRRKFWMSSVHGFYLFIIFWVSGCHYKKLLNLPKCFFKDVCHNIFLEWQPCTIPL